MSVKCHRGCGFTGSAAAVGLHPCAEPVTSAPLEPPVVVTEEDRREARRVTNPNDGEPAEGSAWAVWLRDGGDRVRVPLTHVVLPFTKENRFAHAIARARTTAEFEERCQAVKRLVGDGSRRFAAAVAMLAAVACVDYEAALVFLSTETTDDDIRRLVLQGWTR